MGKATGLGLASIHGVVMQNGGSIDVESEPNRGTTFRVFLPRFAEDSEPSPGA
jgi:two-component system cell cycle sensor histidine kinase/response regulator CckA